MSAVNPWIGVNYFPTISHMEIPPSYWLQRLYDFDNQLVVFPSKKQPFAYVLARRRQRSAGFTDKALIDTIDQPDTKFCLQHGMVPVTVIFRTGIGWSIDNILQELRKRDIWAAGGAQKFADALDEGDRTREKYVRAGIRDDLWNRSGDAWRSYQARTGQRSRLTVGQSQTGTAT